MRSCSFDPGGVLFNQTERLIKYYKIWWVLYGREKNGLPKGEFVFVLARNCLCNQCASSKTVTTQIIYQLPVAFILDRPGLIAINTWFWKGLNWPPNLSQSQARRGWNGQLMKALKKFLWRVVVSTTKMHDNQVDKMKRATGLNCFTKSKSHWRKYEIYELFLIEF